MKTFTKKRTRWTAKLLLVIMAISGLCGMVALADQSKYLGTNAALGSPLVSDNFTTDNWNSWEMLCFGVFLSNFAEPFEDDYTSAFTEGATYGSEGRGLEALQFSAGGDAAASGYLKDMVDYCKLQQSVPFKQISVDYNLFEYNQDINFDAGITRQAYFDDLMPFMVYYENVKKSNGGVDIGLNSKIPNPALVFNTAGILTDTNVQGAIDNDDAVDSISYIEAALLPTFYAGEVGAANPDENAKIFDMTSSWDIQVLKALFAKSFNKYAASSYTAGDEETGMDTALGEKWNQYLGQTCPLVMDCFGNICMVYNGKNIILIPSSANQYITETPNHNYLNSLVLNNYVMSDSDSEGKISAYAEGDKIRTVNTGLVNATTSLNIGNAPIKHTDDITDGKLLITVDSDTNFMNALYAELAKDNKGIPNTDVLDSTEVGTYTLAYEHDKTSKIQEFASTYAFGKDFISLLDVDALRHKAVQFHITGANSKVTTTKVYWFWNKNLSDADTHTIDSALGAYGLLSTFQAVDEGDNYDTLDYFYNYEESVDLEETKKQLFDGGYYLTPREATGTKAKKYDRIGKKMFINYFMQILDGQQALDPNYIQDILSKEQRFEQLDFVKKQIGPMATGNAMVIATSEDATNQQPQTLSTNIFLKSFMGNYYKLAKDKEINDITDNSLTLSNLYQYFDTSKVARGKIDWQMGSSTTVNQWAVDRVVRVFKPNSIFNTIASIFSMSEGSQFEVYSTRIYVTYLEFYGLLNNKSADLSDNKFNQTLFKDSGFVAFTGANFTNGISQEQMEANTKLNVFKLLDLSKAGEEYRLDLFESFVRTTFVYPMDEKLEEKSVGNVGVTSRFLDVEMLEDNFLIGDMIKEHWETVALTLFWILTAIAVLSGLLNNRGIGWYITIMVAVSTMVISLPYYMNIAPTLIEKYINSSFQTAGSYWAIAESAQSDKTAASISGEEDENMALSMLSTLNFLDTDSSLMVKLDISQKVISNTAINYQELQRMPSARWLLPSLMQQMSSDGTNFDYISVPTTRLYNNFAKIWVMYHKDAEYKPIVRDKENSSSIAELTDIPSSTDKQGYWQGDAGSKQGYIDGGTAEPAGDTSKSISQLDTGNLTHTAFYLLNNSNIQSAHAYLGKTEGMTKADWEQYAKDVSERKVSGGDVFNAKADEMLGVLNEFNQYQDAIPQSFGYLWNTENLGTYFYTLVKDTFNEDATSLASGGNTTTGKSLAYIMLQLQGTTVGDTDKVRTSFMHQGETGNVRDICDLEEVFINMMPYMYQMMLMANGTTDHNGFCGADKMIGNAYYADNYKSWMFRTNWVTKIYEDNLFSGSGKAKTRDASGVETGEYTISNISDPRSYPDTRPMVFSEAQMKAQNLTEADLTYTEICCVNVNNDVSRRWTTLINYANTSNLTKEVIFRQMGMEALFSFNEHFNRDNLIMRERTMYPTNYDLRKLSFVTIFRSLITSLTKNASFMTEPVSATVFKTYGFLAFVCMALMFYAMQLFALFRDLFVVAAFVSAVATLVFNFMTTSTEKFRSMVGWLVTSVFYCGITMLYYCFINFLIGNPTADTLVNLAQITSSKLTQVAFYLWAVLLAVLSLCYVYIIIWYFYQLWVGHKFGLSVKDGGFMAYHDLATKLKDSIVGATHKMGDKLHGGLNGLKGIGPGSKEDTKVTVQNKVKTETEDDTGVYQGKRKHKTDTGGDLAGIDLESNFNSGEVSFIDMSDLTERINTSIKQSKKAAQRNVSLQDVAGQGDMTSQLYESTVSETVQEIHENI